MPKPLPDGTVVLIQQMDRLVQLMDQDGHTYWSARVREATSTLRRGEREGFQIFLSGFGTSGSFNECVVGKGEWVGGKFVWGVGQQAVHEEFQRLQSEAYCRARKLQRESDPSLVELLAMSWSSAPFRTRVLVATLLLLFFAFVGYACSR
jgi:hypothetical protein